MSNNSLLEIEKKFETLAGVVGKAQGEYEYMCSEKNKTELSICSLECDKERYKKAIELLTMVQHESRDKVKEGFESIITHALNFVFDEDYQFELEFGKRGNLQELNFNIKKPGFTEAYDILDTNGGGLVDLISLALRIVLMELNTPKIEGFIILDESLKHLSENFLPNANEFLKEIQSKLNRQFIFVSHQKVFTESNYNVINIA